MSVSVHFCCLLHAMQFWLTCANYCRILRVFWRCHNDEHRNSFANRLCIHIVGVWLEMFTWICWKFIDISNSEGIWKISQGLVKIQRKRKGCPDLWNTVYLGDIITIHLCHGRLVSLCIQQQTGDNFVVDTRNMSTATSASDTTYIRQHVSWFKRGLTFCLLIVPLML